MKTDWDKCCLCQRVTTEALQCPAKSKRLDIGVGQGYSTLYANIKRFSELCELPIPVDLDRLDEGNGIEATFLNNKAMWHKSCYNKFNTTKLRAERTKCSIEDIEAETTPARKYTGKSARHEDKMVQDICFFFVQMMHQHQILSANLDYRGQSRLSQDVIAYSGHRRCLVGSSSN